MYTFEHYQEFTGPFLSPHIKQATDITLTTIADKINRGEAYEPAPTLPSEKVPEPSPNPPTNVAANTTYLENSRYMSS